MPAPWSSLMLLGLALSAGACTTSTPAPGQATLAGTVRERIAALTLRQSDFGSVSLIPVRFEHARLAGPFAEGGRTFYCVSARMLGRTFGKPERPKVVIEDVSGVLKVVDEEEACSGQRSEPFPELEASGSRAG